MLCAQPNKAVHAGGERAKPRAGLAHVIIRILREKDASLTNGGSTDGCGWTQQE